MLEKNDGRRFLKVIIQIQGLHCRREAQRFPFERKLYIMWRSSLAVLCLMVGGLVGFVVNPVLPGQVPAAIPIPGEMTSYRDVVKHVLPAVVSIEVKTKAVAHAKQSTSELQPFSNDSRIPKEFRKLFEEFQQPFQLPHETPSHGFGSGFIVDARGVILTNYHVVKGADEVLVRLHNGQQLVSKDIKSDPKSDLAVVWVESKTPLPYLELGNSDAMEIGDRVLAAGAPYGLTGSVTAGIISGKGRALRMSMYEDFLQTDAAINPGNSGGPLVNLAGQVIGINTAIKSQSGGSQGIGLAVASNMAKNILQQLVKEGVVHRGYLGIQIKPLQQDVAAHLGLGNKTGVVVSDVVANAPASRAGLQAGDVITSLAGKPIKDAKELQALVMGLPLNKPAKVELFRDGKALTLEVTVAEQPKEYGLASTSTPSTSKSETEGLNLSSIGVKVADMTQQQAEQLGFKEKLAGALVTEVQDNGLAAEAGLSKGVVIVKIDHQPVASAEAAQNALEKASLTKGVLLQVRSQNGVEYVLLQSSASKLTK